MRVILIGGGETIETIYYLARHFADRGYHVAIVNPHPEEARMLSRRTKASVFLGDGSDPAVLEEAGARRADVILSLAPYDPDNLASCQLAQMLFGVPRTMALVNDPDHEEVFRQLGVTEVLSATRVIGSLIEGRTVLDEVTNLFPAAEGRFHVTELVLPTGAPAISQSLQALGLPRGALVAAIVRGEQVLVPRGESRLEATDRLILITTPDSHAGALKVLIGEEGA